MTQSEFYGITQQLETIHGVRDIQPLKIHQSKISTLPTTTIPYDITTVRDALHFFSAPDLHCLFQEAKTRTKDDGHIIIVANTQGNFYRMYKPDFNTYFGKTSTDGAPVRFKIRTKQSEIEIPTTNFATLLAASTGAGWNLDKADFSSKYVARGEIVCSETFNKPGKELEKFMKEVLTKKTNHPDIFYEHIYLSFSKKTASQ